MSQGARLGLLSGLAVLALLLQCSGLAVVPILGSRLDAMLVLAIAAGWHWGPLGGAAWALGAGSLLDGVSGTGLHHGLSKAIVASLAGWSRPSLEHLAPLLIGLLVVVLTLLDSLCLAVLWRLDGHTWVWERVLRDALPLGVVHLGLWLLLHRFDTPEEAQS